MPLISPPPADSQGTEIGPPPPFDPECAAMLAPLAEILPPAITPDMIQHLRDNPPDARATDEELSRGGAFTVEERSVDGPEGAPEILLLICRPSSASAPVGAVYFIHGGGMVIGVNRESVSEALDWAQALQLAVVSVEYRLAPEHPHPAPVEDCYAGLVWTAEHAAELGIDPDRIVIAGVSAGGGLAAATALLARDRGGPALFGQVLLCPMLDDRNDSGSALQMAGIGVWDRTSNETGWTALLGDARGGPDISPYAAPARATDLSGLPPTFIDVGSAETFRDEDIAYASRIWAAGGNAELHVWPGGYHGYYEIVPHAQVSQETVEARMRWMRRLMAP